MNRSFVSALFFLSALGAISAGCPSQSVEPELDADALVKAGDGLVFLTNGVRETIVHRYRCDETVAAETLFQVTQACTRTSPAQGLELAVLLQRLGTRYLARMRDAQGSLSTQELRAVEGIGLQLQGLQFAEQSTGADATSRIFERLYDLLPGAYDDAPLAPVSVRSTTPTSVVAGSPESAIAAGDIPPKQATTSEELLGQGDLRLRWLFGRKSLRVQLRRALPYNRVRIEFSGPNPNEACRGLRSAEPSELAVTPTADHAALSWMLPGNSVLGALDLRVRTGVRLGEGMTCTARVYAVRAVPPPPPPPPPGDPLEVMQTLMGNSEHRAWHYLWHGVRNAWDRLRADQQAQIVATFGPEWQRQPADANVGEEFLHMHRVMINGLLAEAKAKNVLLYPTGTAQENLSIFPDVWTNPGRFSTDGAPLKLFSLPSGSTTFPPTLLQWDIEARGAKLALSLGEYGTWLEDGLHNTMHMQWSDSSDGSDGPGDLFQSDTRTLLETPPASWLASSNCYLGSTYTAHVHPLFWRIHGYVDNRIGDWLRARDYTRIAEPSDASCTESARCYAWKRIWDGHTPSDSPHAGHGTTGAKLGVAFGSLQGSLRRVIADNSTMSPPR